jgi:hypothetical protein
MQPHKALIAGVVDPGDDVPRRWRRLAIDAQVTLAAALDNGMTHIDCDLLRLAAAKLPDLRGGHCSRGNTGLRRGCHAKGRRQLRFFARQRDGLERARITARRCPEMGQNFLRRLHRGDSYERGQRRMHTYIAGVTIRESGRSNIPENW